MIRSKLFSAILVAGVALTSAAQANQMSISYDSSRMDDPAYVSELRTKVMKAAQNYCRQQLAGAYTYRGFNKCVDETVSQTWAGLKSQA